MLAIRFIFILSLVGIAKPSGFTDFSNMMLQCLEGVGQCKNPEKYVTLAQAQEDANPDKVIVYHAETYGAWITQWLYQKLNFPQAQNWLALRFGKLGLLQNVKREDLMKMAESGGPMADSNPKFKSIGLSASPYLISSLDGESAWDFGCGVSSSVFNSNNWNKVDVTTGDSFSNVLVTGPKQAKFLAQLDLVMTFIQARRTLKPIYNYDNLVQKFTNNFPNTMKAFTQYQAILKSYEGQRPASKYNFEGIFLQIVLDKAKADKHCYDAEPYGIVKNKAPYSQVYPTVKNKVDETQLRIAMSNSFRVYNSDAVQVFPLAGIMFDQNDYAFLKSLINEMTQLK